MRMKQFCQALLFVVVTVGLFFAGSKLGERMPAGGGEAAPVTALPQPPTVAAPGAAPAALLQVASAPQAVTPSQATEPARPARRPVPIRPERPAARAQELPTDDADSQDDDPDDVPTRTVARRPVKYELTEEEAMAAMFAPGPEPDEETTARLHRLIGQLDTPSLRNASRTEIQEIGRAAVPVLIRHKDDAPFTVRWEVVNIGGNLQDPRQIPSIVENVVRDPNPHIRWRGLWALTCFDDPRPVVRLLRERLADNKESESVRWNAGIGLTMFDCTDALDSIHRGVTGSDQWRRWEAINALGRVFNEQSSRALAPALKASAKRERREAAKSLGYIGDANAIELLNGALLDADDGVRHRARSALDRIEAKR